MRFFRNYVCVVLCAENTEFAANKPKQCAVHDLHEVEMQKMPEVLNEYLVFLAQAGVVCLLILADLVVLNF